MFDIEKGISGENPEHIEFINNVAIPLFKTWGYEITILRANIDYKYIFYMPVSSRTKHPERIGKPRGFVLGRGCSVKKECKLNPIKKYIRQKKEEGYSQIIGIASDEPERLERLNGGDYSLLDRYGYTEKMCLDLCREYGLLSPIYDNSTRGGVGSVLMLKSKRWQNSNRHTRIIGKNFGQCQRHRDSYRKGSNGGRHSPKLIKK